MVELKISLKSFSDLIAHRNKFKVAQGGKDNQDQKVLVTKHAVERLNDWRRAGKPSVKDAERFLIQAALKGKPVGKRPGGAYEVCWQGLYALICPDKDGTLVVLTFNGDREWRNWYRKTHVRVKHRAKVRAAL